MQAANPDNDDNARGNLTQAELVRIGLETDILSGRVLPGSVVDETETSRRYGVSRTPVREAIFLLVQAGLIRKEARKRAIVAELDIDDFFGLFETLAELEGLSAKFAAERMTRAERFELARIHETAAEQLQQGEIDDYAASGRAFHALILDGSDNSTLVRITSELANRLIPYRRFQVTLEGGLQRNQDDHDIILAAIQAGDAEAAYRAMRKHTQDQGDAVIASIPAFATLGRGRESKGEKPPLVDSGGTAL